VCEACESRSCATSKCRGAPFSLAYLVWIEKQRRKARKLKVRTFEGTVTSKLKKLSNNGLESSPP